MLLFIIHSTSYAEDINKYRYADYKFTPIYNQNNDQLIKIGKDIVNQFLLKQYPTGWRNAGKIYGVTYWGTKLVIGYSIGNTKGKMAEKDLYINECKSYYKKHNKKQNGCDFKSNVISVFKGKIHELDLIKSKEDIYPVGHFGRDYYGNVDDKPIFTASMVIGEDKALFSLTGFGNRFSNPVQDRITLDIYGSNLTWKIHEDLMLTNYSAKTKKYKPNPKNKYDYSAYLDESLEQFGLVKSDRRARKKYAKTYIKDLDNDGLLDVLFWHRQYYSTLVKNKTRVGFILEKEWFTLYGENMTNHKMVKSNITNSQGYKLLEDNNLDWKVGYPEGVGEIHMRNIVDESIQ